MIPRLPREAPLHNVRSVVDDGSTEEGAFGAETVARLRAAFEPHRAPEEAAKAAAYLRDQFPFIGLKTPLRRRLAHDALVDLRPSTQAELSSAVLALWAEPEREFHHTGTDLVRAHIGLVDASFLPVLERLITTKPWWDTIDVLGPQGVGPLARNDPSVVAVLDRWIVGPDIWLARAAILHQLTFKEETDVERLFAYCRIRAADREFFLRKAIGWALRQHAATDPDAVAAFLRSTPELSPLSVREAERGVARARR